MLEITGINKTFNPGTINANHALKDLSLHLADGESITDFLNTTEDFDPDAAGERETHLVELHQAALRHLIG